MLPSANAKQVNEAGNGVFESDINHIHKLSNILSAEYNSIAEYSADQTVITPDQRYQLRNRIDKQFNANFICNAAAAFDCYEPQSLGVIKENTGQISSPQ